ncbi:mechanosensitive ion channel family protein [Thalassotalea sp. G20_0]|uniref:mechanosensitive ion channel family protein n=1 Tax=Thalassotalea sp. G20_0 TaxID=2821093 RepID=UPI001ADB95AA|nr:mechanosensitive ion channel family protein [Thalassotalea sp. G20_0]MBO9496039.1 mechanosensitive ion channel family protein [Thalassotalea sp. G20_0]
MDFLSSTSANIPDWLPLAVIATCLTAFTRYLVGKLFGKLTTKVKATQNFWDNALLAASQKPVYLFIWVAGLSWTAEEIWEGTGNTLFQRLLSFRDLLVIVLFCWVFVSFITALEHRYLQVERKKKLDQTSVIALGRLIRIAIIITGILVAMQALGYSLSGILAFGGLGGLAVGFAAKDMLANFFGGWMIYVDKPFRVGDWISSPDKKIEGTVEYIGWRQTRIMTFAKHPLYVPNSTFMNISVENPSRMQNRRIKQVFGLRYRDSDKVNVILEDVRSYLRHHDAIDQDKIIIVNFIRFGASSLDCQVYCFTKTTDWAAYLQIQENVLLEIISIIHSHEADIAFPTRTLELSDQGVSDIQQRAGSPSLEAVKI